MAELSHEEPVRRAREWAAREGHELQIVFDGLAAEDAPTSPACATRTTRSPSSLRVDNPQGSQV